MKKKFFSLQYKFFLYFLLLSIIPTTLTGVLAYWHSSKVIIEKAKEINTQKLNSITANINSTMSHVNEVSHLILQNNDLKDYIYGNSAVDSSVVLNFLTPFVGYNNSISSIAIESFTGETLIIGDTNSAYGLSDEQKAHADLLNGYFFWDMGSLPGIRYNLNPVPSFSFIRLYRDMYSLSNHLGYIKIDILESLITGEYNKHLSSEGGIFLIADENGKIICSNKEEMKNLTFDLSSLTANSVDSIGSHDLNEPYIISSQQLDETGWTLIDLTPTSVMLKDNHSIFQIIATVILCNITVCLLLALYISNRHLAPLRTLCDLVRDAGQQRFHEYPGITSNDEVGLLTSEFNNMSQQLETLLNKVYAAQIKQSEAEFQALQAQINPHFLYNTLDTIYWVCRLEHANEASELVKALGDTFRLSLNKGEGLISLQDELKHLTSYLTIQRKRCKTSIDIALDIDSNPKLQDAKVIKLVLQPLVENAFIHGVANNTQKSIIKISVKLEDDLIIYIIEDNGVGINPEFVKELNSSSNKTGFGIRNVNERIKLLFGDEYGITVSSQLGSGTTIVVRQPLHHDDAEKEIESC